MAVVSGSGSRSDSPEVESLATTFDSPSPAEIPLKTSFADIKLALERVETIKFDQKAKKATFVLLNGDRLQGEDKEYFHTSAGKAPDLGAIELGEEWQFPRPGPRWATGDEITGRPPMPASFRAKWVGLE